MSEDVGDGDGGVRRDSKQAIITPYSCSFTQELSHDGNHLLLHTTTPPHPTFYSCTVKQEPWDCRLRKEVSGVS